MDVSQIPCAHCGTVNEIVGRRTFGDYNPLCANCGKPIREARKIEFVGGNGRLYLQHIPGRGLGVFSRVHLVQGTIVERAPAYVIKAPKDTRVMAYLEGLQLLPYTDSSVSQRGSHMCLPWTAQGEKAWVLGYGMLYNHEPQGKGNLIYKPYIEPDTNRRFMDYYALRDIEAGEELTFTYNRSDSLWFDHKRSGGE